MLDRRTTLSLLAAAPFAAGSARAQARPRAVIELFTSQGCSACPPADRLLGEYARDPTVVALTYAVQIWDYLGWRDTLATPENTARQKAYGDTRGDRRVYTPQVIVNGGPHVIGSNRAAIEARCAARGAGLTAHAVSVGVVLERLAGRIEARVDAWAAPLALPPVRALLATFDATRTVAVERGENSGQSMTYFNVVRGLRDLGPWGGAPTTFGHPVDAGVGAALLLQAVGDDGGPSVILGAQIIR